MSTFRKFAWLLLVPALAAMFLVACGGDDDGDDNDDRGGVTDDRGNDDRDNDDNDNDNGNDSDGDGDDDGGDIEASGDTGSDKEYVADVCAAARKWSDDFLAAFEDLDFEDPDGFADALAGPTREFAEDLADAKPPRDLQDWHADTVSSFSEFVDLLESGDFDLMSSEDSGPEFPEMPADAEARLSKIAEDNEDCQAMAAEGEDIFGEP